jgi:autotransporter-associated beta strand protein
MSKGIFMRATLALLCVALAWAGDSDFTWNGAGNDWSQQNNWTSSPTDNGFPDANADIARFTGPGANQPDLSNDREVNQLHFGAGGAIALTGTNTLTLSGTTPSITVTSGTHSIACPVALGANLAIQVDAGCQLTISGAISGAFAITKTGTGTLILSGANGHTGAVQVSAGTLRIEHATALGTTAAGTTVSAGAMLTLANGITVTGEAIAMNGTLRIDSSTSCTLSGAVGLTFGGTPSIEVLQGTHSFAATIDVTVNADTTAFVASGSTLTISDTVLAGNGLITKVGSGTLTFADGTAPTTPSITAPTNGSTVTDTTPSWTWTGAGGTYRYALDGGTAIPTTATSFTPGAALGNGSHTLTVAERDAAGNWSGNASNTITIDGTAPYIVSRTTIDADVDGQIDAIDVVMSEAMGTATGTWTVAGYAVGAMNASNWQTTTRLRIPITETATPDTGALPAVRYQSGAVADAAGNLLATEGAGITPADGAAPVLTSFSGTFGSTSATITFSEPVATAANGTGNLVAGDFTYTPGTTSIAAFSDANGLDKSVSITTSAAVASGDTIAAVAASIYDTAGNAAGTASKVIAQPTATKDTAQAGDWASAATWVGGTIPTASDDVVIKHAVTLTQPGSSYTYYQVKTLTIDTGGSLNATGVVSSTTYYTLLSVVDRVVESRVDTTIGNIQFYDNGSGLDFIFRVASGTTLTLLNTAQGHFVRSVVKQGAGTLVWQSIANLYPNVPNGTYDDGPLRVEAGSFRLATAGGRDAGYALTVQGGALLDLRTDYNTSTLSGQGTITRGAAGTSTLTMAGSSWSGTLQNGSGTLAVAASGSNTWSGENTFTGGLSLTGGTLDLSGTQAIGDTCAVSVAVGATLNVLANERLGALSGGGGITLPGTTLTVDHGAAAPDFSGIVSGTGGLAITGSGGTLTLSGANTYTGGTSLTSGGTLVISSSANLGASSSALTFDGGRLRLAAHVNLTGAAVSTVAVGSGPSATIATQGASPANRTIAVTANDGTIELGAFSLAVAGFDTAIGQDLTIIGNGTAGFNSADPALFVVCAGSNTWAGRLLAGSAFGFLCKQGAGSLAITNGANTWSKRVVRAEAGTLQFGASGALGTVSDWVFVLPGATGRLDGVTYASAPTLYLSGTLSVNGSSSWQGPVDLWSATPVIDVAAASDLTLSGTVSRSSATSLGKTGAGTLVLGAANTFTLPVTVTAGVVSVAADNRLGAVANQITLNGGTLAATGTFSSSRSFVLGASGGTCDVTGGQTLTLDATSVVSGAGILRKSGTGTLVLAGTNTYGGGTSVTAGELSIAADANLGSAATGLTLDGGTLRATASATLTGRPVAIGTAGGTINATSGTVQLPGILSGSGILTTTGSGVVALSGANTITGAIQVAAGTLSARSAGALGTTAGSTTVADGAILDLAGTFSTSEPLQLTGIGVASAGVLVSSSGSQTLNGAVTLVQSANPVGVSVATGGILTMSGAVSGAGGLGKGGLGTLVLGTTNSFTGQVTVIAGVVAVGADDRLGNSANEVLLNGGTLLATASFASATRTVRIGTAGGTIDTATYTVTLPGIDTGPAQNLILGGSGTVVLNIGNSQNRTLAGRISGTAGLTKDGAGDLVITNATNDLTGPTLLETGGLSMAGVLPGTVTVTVGATLSGAGTIGSLVVQAGGVVSPAGGGAGVLTVGALSPAAGAMFNMNIGGASDLISVTGATPIVLAGAVALSGEDAAPSGIYTLISAPAASVSGTMVLSPDPNDVNARYALQTTATQLQVVRDSQSPTISSITSVDPDGEYDNGDTVNVRVVFSEPVYLAGGLELTLNTTPSATVTIPPSAAPGVYASEFDGLYTVVAPEVSADLSVTQIAFLGGGSYTDAVGYAVTTIAGLPAQNLGNLKNIAIVNRLPLAQINDGAPGDTQPSAVAMSTREARLFHPSINDATRVLVDATDQETADRTQLTYNVLLEPSQGEVQYSADGSFAAGTKRVVTTVTDAATQVASFTQDDVDNGRVRYEHTALSGGNDAILMTVSDGDGNASALYLMRFAISGNAAPSISGLPGTLTYTEESTHAAWVQVAASATVADDAPTYPDARLTFAVANATASSGDELGFLPSATAVTVDGSGTVRVGATLIGTLTRTAGYAFTIDFDPASTADDSDVVALISALAYRNVIADPDPTLARTVQISIRDNTIGQTPNLYTIPVQVTLFNDPPVITAGAPIISVPNVARTVNITVSDPEGDSAITCAIAGTPVATKGALQQTGPTTFVYTPYYPTAGEVGDPLIDAFAIYATDSGFDPGAADPRLRGSDGPATSADITYTARISDGGGAAPRFDAPMRMTVAATLPFSYPQQVTAQPGASLSWELLGTPAELATDLARGSGDPAKASFDPASGQLTWPSVPAPGDGSGYYRFGIMVIDATSQTATVLPVMLRVGPGGAG